MAMTKIRKLNLLLIVLLILVAAIRYFDLNAALAPEQFKNTVAEMGYWGPLLYVLVFAVAPSLFIPGLPLTIAGGLAFGPVWGVVWASIGSTIGASIAFLIARYFARDAVFATLGGLWATVDEGVCKRGWFYVALTRLVPLLPFNLLNYAFGLTQIRFLTYVFVSWIFMLPGTAAYVMTSGSLMDILVGKASPMFLVGLALFAVVFAISLGFRYKSQSLQEKDE